VQSCWHFPLKNNDKLTAFSKGMGNVNGYDESTFSRMGNIYFSKVTSCSTSNKET
jgi:hypothetical protein